MRKRNKILIWVIAVIAGIFIILNLILPSFAKKIIIEQIEGNFKVKASLGGMNITPPFSINLIDLLANFYSYMAFQAINKKVLRKIGQVAIRKGIEKPR